ncbi:MAG: amidase domain-containing protein [Clostridium sp.]|nr:amidase domain-containing protein [Clostridium sp.]
MKINLLIKLIFFFFLILNIYSFPCYSYSIPDYDIPAIEEETNILDTNEDLKCQFKVLLDNLFLNRNSSILSKDSEGLKSFYNLDKKTGQWAYENETKKIKYFSNWCEKQGASFSKINSIVKISKASEKEKDLYGIICYVSTEFFYKYEDEPCIENRFKLGTCHYLNLRKNDDNKFIIEKEWYTDPLADSLDLNTIKSDEIKNYILSHKAPNYQPDERTQKAIDYAHTYCGISDNEENLFKYNKNYRNFNPDGGDCANFASQILYEGGSFKKNSSWNYYGKSATKAWINAQEFKNYMVNSDRASYIAKGSYDDVYKSAFNLRPGDFVGYEKKGRITHISTVTGLDSKGYPLVTCHNTDRMLVPYDLGWSNDNIKFHFLDVHY